MITVVVIPFNGLYFTGIFEVIGTDTQRTSSEYVVLVVCTYIKTTVLSTVVNELRW